MRNYENLHDPVPKTTDNALLSHTWKNETEKQGVHMNHDVHVIVNTVSHVDFRLLKDDTFFVEKQKF